MREGRTDVQTDRRTDGRTDGRKDGRTDGVKPIYPPNNFVCSISIPIQSVFTSMAIERTLILPILQNTNVGIPFNQMLCCEHGLWSCSELVNEDVLW